MAEITAKRSGELLRGVFSILEHESDGLAAKEVLRRLVDLVPPTPFESDTYPKNPTVRRYEKIVRFASIGPVKAGWLFKEKGTWSLTVEGIQAYHQFSDPTDFLNESKRLYKEWAKAQPDTEEDDTDTVVDEISTTFEEAEETAWSETSDYLAKIDPYELQDLVAGLLQGMGYHISYISPPGPDKGIDIIAHTDPLGVVGPKIKVQVKRHKGKVDAAELRAFVGLLTDSDVGLFINLGGFTRNAEQEMRDHQSKRVMLIDMAKLFDLWIEHYDNIPEETRQLMLVKPVHYLIPPG